MLDFIARFGEVTVGLIAIVLVLALAVALLIELYDRVTGADKKRQEEIERLRFLEEEL